MGECNHGAATLQGLRIVARGPCQARRARFARSVGGLYYQATKRTEADRLAVLSRIVGEHHGAGVADEIEAGSVLGFKVSREVILRRLLDAGHVSLSEYREKTWEWFQEYRTAERGAGGNYYNTEAAYLGKAFLDLAFSQFHAGRVSLPELADHHGIKTRNGGRLEETLLARILATDGGRMAT